MSEPREIEDMASKGIVNGSADALAHAFRDVIAEAVKPVSDEVSKVRVDMVDMERRLTESINTNNENMQAQFAEQEKKIGQLLKPTSKPSARRASK